MVVAHACNRTLARHAATPNSTHIQISMDINEFMATVKPGKKISRLQKHEKDIRELKARGYTDEQIRQWLAENDVTISREAVRKFLKKLPTEGDKTKATEITSPDAKPEAKGESNFEKIQRQVAEQKEKAAGSKFKHDKLGDN
jgi:hypothetical protein